MTTPPYWAGAAATPVSNVSDTARWAAFYRAGESDRPDALFRDPFARRLAGPVGEAIAQAAPGSVRNGWPVVVRTLAIDEMVMRAVAEGCDCVLNLAAGLDTRPQRLPLPESLPWIEADLPAVIDAKASLLADAPARCRLVREKVDLADAGARSAFLDRVLARHGRVLVITEGLLMYLDEPTVIALARDLDRPKIVGWILDLLSPRIRDSMMRRMKDLANAPMRFAPANGVAFFETLGWKAAEIRSQFADARRLKRLPGLLRVLGMLPLPEPDPRKVASAHWAGVVRLVRAAG